LSRLAAGIARDGDVVLLAPAAASFDQFTSYADRGPAIRRRGQRVDREGDDGDGTTRPRRPPQLAADPTARRGLAARVSLGRVFAPVPSEFLLIASTALLLTGFGLVMVLSATSATSAAAGRPARMTRSPSRRCFAVIGIPLMFVASRLPVSFWKRAAWPALIGALVFQMLVFTPLGYELYGNRNWISIGGFTAQPSEFLKLALALWIGYVLYPQAGRSSGSGATCSSRWCPVSILVIATVLAGRDLGTGDDPRPHRSRSGCSSRA
jgi:cell division protein FtsW